MKEERRKREKTAAQRRYPGVKTKERRGAKEAGRKCKVEKKRESDPTKKIIKERQKSELGPTLQLMWMKM